MQKKSVVFSILRSYILASGVGNDGMLSEAVCHCISVFFAMTVIFILRIGYFTLSVPNRRAASTGKCSRICSGIVAFDDGIVGILSEEASHLHFSFQFFPDMYTNWFFLFCVRRIELQL